MTATLEDIPNASPSPARGAGRVRVAAFSISLDGYGCGANQSLTQPMGEGGMGLHTWALGTPTFRRMFGQEGGSPGLDEDYAADSFRDVGAWILGRNMFSPHRGPWPDEQWRGWWGEEPPYHCPVFVLTHHARPDLAIQGGTVFHFVHAPLAEVIGQARAAAGGRDVRLGGGVDTVRQGLAARLIDEMHLAISPVLLGRGEALLAGLDLPALGYRVARSERSALATHVVIDRQVA